MKSLIFTLCLVSSFAFAEEASLKVKDINMDKDSATTIQVKKGALDNTVYEINTGTEEVEGDSAPLLKEARVNWKSACSDWKTETKNLNKDNQVIALNCGHMNCKTTESESTCSSTGTYKVRVRVQN